MIPRMPSAALLARASSAPPSAEKTAEAIVADVLTETDGRCAEERPRRGPIACAPATRSTRIAKRTGTTVNQLKSWNKLRGTNLKVGTRLLIQSPRTANTQ